MCYRIDNSYSDDYNENFIPFCPYYQELSREFPHPGYHPPMSVGPQGGPPHGGPQGRPPTAPPPFITPHKSQSQITAVSPGSIRPCTFRYVYIWLTNGRSFWAWLNRVDRWAVSGWRWTGSNWMYFGMDLRRIESFVCY